MMKTFDVDSEALCQNQKHEYLKSKASYEKLIQVFSRIKNMKVKAANYKNDREKIT